MSNFATAMPLSTSFSVYRVARPWNATVSVATSASSASRTYNTARVAHGRLLMHVGWLYKDIR